MASAVAAQGVSFPTTVIYPVGSFPRSLAIADFDGDGKADLAVVNKNSQTVSILLGHGDGGQLGTDRGDHSGQPEPPEGRDLQRPGIDDDAAEEFADARAGRQGPRFTSHDKRA